MTFGTTACIIAASLLVSASPLAVWAAECTDGRCRCFGDGDCTALFESGQCQRGSEVKRTTESLSLCTLETKKITVGQCQQISSGRDLLILSDEADEVAEFPHVSKSCGG